jgi:signal transduction histidine kinase
MVAWGGIEPPTQAGPGIPPALLENLFRRPFSSGDDRRNDGLGLLIVQRIPQLHGSGIGAPGRAWQGSGVSIHVACTAA